MPRMPLFLRRAPGTAKHNLTWRTLHYRDHESPFNLRMAKGAVSALSTAAKWLGLAAIGAGTALLLFVAAYPLGLVRAYPAPPPAMVDGPLGLDHRIADLRTLYRR